MVKTKAKSKTIKHKKRQGKLCRRHKSESPRGKYAKKSSKLRKNGFHKDIVVLEEKTYKPQTHIVVLLIILIVSLSFALTIKQIPFFYKYWTVLISSENIKLYLSLIIVPLLIGMKFYTNHKLKNKINLKL